MNCHRPHYSTQTQMERATRRKSSNDEKPNRSSSFDCDSASMDSILGLKTLGERNLRFDRAEPWRIQDLPAPLKPNCSHTVLELDAMLRRERLVRLLDRQQAWYDSAQPNNSCYCASITNNHGFRARPIPSKRILTHPTRAYRRSRLDRPTTGRANGCTWRRSNPDR